MERSEEISGHLREGASASRVCDPLSVDPLPNAPSKPTSLTTKVLLLSGLYFAQGLPFGFFTQTLPVVLREQGVSLAEIGFSSLLALPWALKFLIAPLVDRTLGSRLGRRRSWILPLQAASILLMVWLSFCPPEASLLPLLVAVFLANLVAATQDVAADGLAVEILTESERGLGNGLQVAAYRAGMILGGGVILASLETLGWANACRLMALGLFLASLPVLRHREPVFKRDELEAPSLKAGIVALGVGWLLLLGAFKVGDALASPMLRPLLVDLGHDKTAIGWLLGIGGFSTGMLGALAGGWLAGRSRRRGLIVGSVLQVIGLLAYALVTLEPTWERLVAASLFEHFAGGVAMVSLFTIMMDACRRGHEATDYTLQACAVVLTGGLASALSGLVAKQIGYGWLFFLGAVLSAGGALLLLSRPTPTPTSGVPDKEPRDAVAG